VVLSGASINAIDATGLDALARLAERMQAAGQTLAFCGLKKQVIDVLERDPLWPRIRAHAGYRHEHAALAALAPQLGKSESFDKTDALD
jgi:SulP family sulfate permease